MSNRRIPTWLALIVLGIGGLLAAILGLFAYVSLTVTPLHPDPEKVPLVSHSAPAARWAEAVEQARQTARTQLTERNLPGLSVAVGVDGDLVWAEGFGWADLENKVPVAPDTRFAIGTASMVLTSAAVGVLLEKEALRLDDEIRMHVPEFPEKEWPVTLRHLMGHVAGVRNDAGDEEPVGEHCDRTLDGLQRFADRSLLFEPGTQFRPSSYGWILVSAAVESAAGEPFFTFVREHVFEPLGMSNTTAAAAAEPAADETTFYFPRFAADPRYGPQGAEPVDSSCFAGAGAFASTPSDLVRFGMAMHAGKLLKADTVELLQAPQRLPSGEETGYGLGWDLETVELAGAQTRVVGHDGALRGGMVASLMTFRDRGLVVAVTSNTAFADTFAIGVKIAEAFATVR